MWRGQTETRADGIGELVLNVKGRILTGGLGVEGGIAFQEDLAVFGAKVIEFG